MWIIETIALLDLKKRRSLRVTSIETFTGSPGAASGYQVFLAPDRDAEGFNIDNT